MARIRLYFDEDVHVAVARGVRTRGIDVLTAHEAGRVQVPDDDHLRFAATEGRMIVTCNRVDFVKLHTVFLAHGEHHAGVLVSPQGDVGAMVKALLKLIGSRHADGFVDQLVWLRV